MNPVTLRLYDFYIVPGPCRANVLLGNWTQPMWETCTLQTLLSLLFLAWESDQGLQAVMTLRERLLHAAASRLSCKLWVFGRHRCLCVCVCVCRARWLSFCPCIFFVFRCKYLSYGETEQKRLFVFTVSAPPDDFLYSCVMDFTW